VRVRTAVACLAAALAAAAGTAPPRDRLEQAYRANNRGVAMLEQFKAPDAVAAFREALQLAPELPLARTNLAIGLLNVPDLPGAEKEARAALAAQPGSLAAQYVLGLAARGLDHADDAKAAFRAVIARDPRDVGAQVNLGQMLMQERAYPEAVAALRAALEAQPFNATAAYNLGLALTRSGQAEEGQAMLERFRTLRESGAATLIGQSYPEQGRYAEALASTGAEADLVDTATPPARFVDATSATLAAPGGSKPGGRPLLFDADGDGDLDLLDASPAGLRGFTNEKGRFTDATTAWGLTGAGVGAIAGDVDADSRPDLVVLRADGVTLYRNGTDGRFTDGTAAAGLAGVGGARTAALGDVDHDGDLDLVLGAQQGGDRLLRNTGAAEFTDVAKAAQLTAPASVSSVVPTDFDNGRDLDLLESVADGAPRLWRNQRDGTFRDVAASVGLGDAPARCVAVADVNQDGYADAFFGSDGGDRLARSDGVGRFVTATAPWGSKGTAAALFLDYDNDGLADLVAAGPSGTRLLRNLGSRWEDVSTKALGPLAREEAAALAAGDLDGDGDTDLLARLASGALRVWRNEGGRNASLRVTLAGRVSNRSGVGSKLEMRAGALKQKLETSAATPAVVPADVTFGLGPRKAADAVRVIWPSGILQTEMEASAPSSATPSVARLAVEELDRKPSSCPYLYAWNGADFGFVTDFMGGGEMGYFMAPGVWNAPDPLEYVRLTDAQLRPRDGRYELRVTNELEEALFVDRLALVAYAHPRDVEVHPHEGMTAPPKADRVFAVKGARPPRAATDDRGRDVLDTLRAMDRRYPDTFDRERIRGYARSHALTLDLGPLPERAALLLTGWTDYAFSSDNVAAHQAALAMHPPALEVEDAQGAWVTAVDQVGIPVGRPQTVVVDLTGIWKGPSRRVRLVTSMRVLWDEVRVGEIVDATGAPVTLEARSAVLRERGFSAETTPDGREPFGYDYARVSRVSPWKAIPGRYTREGDVRELLAAADDAFVTSRPGDEVALSFDAAGLPALPAGWTRTFLLLSDGFSKEMDINSATPDTLGPIPFHGMTRYPYASPERFPMTDRIARLREQYDTRVVAAPLASLDSELARR
jgi:cytochrome c-type biogenesis protein CcmH/NrfG